MTNITQRNVALDGVEVSYLLERKRVKNINLHIRQDGSLYASAHPSVPAERVDAFLISKSAHILSALRRFEEREQYRLQPKEYVDGEIFYIQGQAFPLRVTAGAPDLAWREGGALFLRVKDPADFRRKQRAVVNYLNTCCRALFDEILTELYPRFVSYGVAFPVLRLREMKSRWGSCLVNKGIVTLNTRLLEYPRRCAEYVMAHELCHFLYPNHSGSFYAQLTIIMPDWKECRQLLNRF